MPLPDEWVYIEPRPRLGDRPALSLDELRAVALRRLPGAIEYQTTTQGRRPEETVVVFFDGHSLVGQRAFYIESSRCGLDATVEQQLAGAKANGEPWTWSIAGTAGEVALTLHEETGTACEELCKVIWDWHRYESPPETVRVALITDEGAEIRWIAIARDEAGRVKAVYLRPKGAPTVGPPSHSPLRRRPRRGHPKRPPACWPPARRVGSDPGKHE
jgi:hypothetical protein